MHSLRTLHYDRGLASRSGPHQLLAIELGASGRPLAALPATWGTVEPIAFDASTPRRRFTLREDDAIPAMPVFTINNEAFPNITPVRGPVGQVEIWEIENLAEMDHPFHLHGMSFQTLDANGNPAAGWKDTVNVPQESTVRFAVRFGAAGRWMYHCHILEHAERGMMGGSVRPECAVLVQRGEIFSGPPGWKRCKLSRSCRRGARAGDVPALAHGVIKYSRVARSRAGSTSRYEDASRLCVARGRNTAATSFGSASISMLGHRSRRARARSRSRARARCRARRT
jgi:hypothetical protein